jgi:hypothetical protein
MQYLYSLTSNSNDFYYEQFLISVASLKFLMPNATVVLLCDSKTKETLTEKRREHEKFVSKIITVNAPGNMPQIEVSRWVRTSMRRLVSGDFLFLDGDTIVTDDLSSIADMGIKFGACLDKHLLIDRHPKKESIIEKDKHLGFNSYLSNRHFNGGVLFCADIPETHKIFDRWHELWLFCRSKNIVRDQPALNMAIYENASHFTELDGTWNCQIAYNGLPYLANSRIIHYFATDMVSNASPYIFASEEIHRHIKNAGFISDAALELLKNPREAFAPESQIIAGSEMLHVLNSDLFRSIFLLRKKMPRLFNFYNWIISICKKIAKFFIVRISRKKDGGVKHYN